MSYMSVLYNCPHCGHHFDTLIKRADRDMGTACPICKDAVSREDECIVAPKVMRASWPDGRRTETAKDLIEAAKIEAESFQMKPSERAKHKKEVAKLRTPAAIRGTSKDKSTKMKDS